MTRDNAIPEAPDFYEAANAARATFAALVTEYWDTGLSGPQFSRMMASARHWARVDGLTADDVIDCFRPDAP